MSATSSMEAAPSTVNSVSLIRWISSSSWSYSSWMLPTMSSTRSSKVMSPAVPPYSSSTMAICTLRSVISVNSWLHFFVSGTKYAGRIRSVILINSGTGRPT